MKLLEQILADLGADMAHSVTFVPGVCCYVRGVKTVVEFTPQKVIIVSGKNRLFVEGEGLTVGKYFEGDLLINGGIRGVGIERS